MGAKNVIVGAGIALVVLLVVFGLWLMGTYNNLVSLSQGVDGQWANVQSVYQRRADLIPNLVSTVKGYMKYESSLLTNITALRSQWQTATTVDEKIAAGSAMDSAISRLLVVAENYPELKASETTSKLMDELAGSENRISVERMRYNDKVKEYDTAIKFFPASFVANMFGFKEKPYFQSQPGAENAPKVNLE